MRIDRMLLREQDARLKSAWHEIEEASQRILRQLAEAESVSPQEARLVLDASYALWRVDQGVHELIDLHRALVERLNKASPARSATASSEMAGPVPVPAPRPADLLSRSRAGGFP